MKKYISFAIMLLFVFAMGCATEPERPIGGDTDEHGCLIAAGYSWCEATEKCQRFWEEPCPGQIENFEQCAAAGNPVMESYPRKCAIPSGETFVETVEEPWLPEDN